MSIVEVMPGWLFGTASRAWLWWVLPWLAFLAFPIADLISTPRPVAVRGLLVILLTGFVVLYLATLTHSRPTRSHPVAAIGIITALATGLGAGLGENWIGLLIYASVAAPFTLAGGVQAPAIGALTLIAVVLSAAWRLDLSQLLLFGGLTLFTGLGMVGARRTHDLISELRTARDELARSAVTEERLRIARDLHDLLGHSLSVIALKSELAGRLVQCEPSAASTEMHDVEQVARQALLEVREAVGGYRMMSLADSLSGARDALAGAGIELRCPDELSVLSPEVDLVLAWVVREGCTNVLRHGRGATEVTVDVTSAEGMVTLSVTDDGSPPSWVSWGSGLSGLAERLEAVGGTLVTGPTIGSGFRLETRLPLPAAEVVV